MTCKSYDLTHDSVTPELAPKNDVADGKLDASLLPMDVLIEYVVPAYQEGVLKYQRESWRKGFHVSKMIAACLRHIKSFFWDKEDYDSETFEKYGIKKHHLGAVVFCMLAILLTLKTRPELDDRPKIYKELR